LARRIHVWRQHEAVRQFYALQWMSGGRLCADVACGTLAATAKVDQLCKSLPHHHVDLQTSPATPQQTTADSSSP